ncbi:hypothetical protein [Elioraea rosea]|uniref:hypothetical protein n=1 Tax=Elioraea rosea TaxID=2492390 RepID=UPI0011837057|nr:hypothetical protein [Elioraea rosea]
MVKASLLVFVVLTVIIAWALKRRQTAPSPAGFVAKKRAAVRLWFDAAAIAVVVTLVTLMGMHWLRLGTWWSG